MWPARLSRLRCNELGIPAGFDLTNPLSVIGHSSEVQHAIDCPKASWFTRRVKRGQTDRFPFSKSIGIVRRLESAPVVRIQRKACVYMQITEERRTLFSETDTAFAPSLSAAGCGATPVAAIPCVPSKKPPPEPPDPWLTERNLSNPNNLQ